VCISIQFQSHIIVDDMDFYKIVRPRLFTIKVQIRKSNFKSNLSFKNRSVIKFLFSKNNEYLNDYKQV
jgi:hypothetical protein